MWKWETENDAKGVVVIAHNILEHTGRYAYVITMLRRNGYHVIMGDLPGQVQTSRTNKGQMKYFNEYHEIIVASNTDSYWNEYVIFGLVSTITRTFMIAR